MPTATVEKAEEKSVQVEPVTDKEIAASLLVILKDLRKKKLTSQDAKMYVCVASDDDFLVRLKKAVEECRPHTNMSYTVYISGGQAADMTEYYIGGRKVYVSVGSDYSFSV